jgi:hypothetical protein
MPLRSSHEDLGLACAVGCGECLVGSNGWRQRDHRQTKFLSIAARNTVTLDASNGETNFIIPTIGFQTIDRSPGR